MDLASGGLSFCRLLLTLPGHKHPHVTSTPMTPLDRNRLKSLMEREQKRFVDDAPKSKAVAERRARFMLSVALAALSILASCAQLGPPLPPSLELPKPPSDLRASRKGNAATLIWSEPTLTTDRQSIRYLGPTRICRSTEQDITVCGSPVATLPAPAAAPPKSKQKPTAPAPPQTSIQTLSAQDQSDDPEAAITYAVEVLNRNARGAGLSNRVHVPAIRTLPAPADLATELNEDGVLLTWTSGGEPASHPGVQYRYRIYRRDESTGKDAIAGEVAVGVPGPARFLDAAEWERTYLYRITGVSVASRSGGELQVEGDDSPAVRVVAHDIFPPSVPSGLEAVFSGEGQKPFIDLIWAPVTSADLAGYNVYRSEDGRPTTKLNAELVKSPSYRDSPVVPGKTYVYSVSAVDVRGNESAKSEEASETVLESK